MSSITKSIATLPTIHTMSGSTTKPCATDCKAPVHAIQRLNRRSNSSITWNASVSRRSTSVYLVPVPSTSTTSMRCSPTWVRMATTCDRGVLCGRLSVILSRSLICRPSTSGKFRRVLSWAQARFGNMLRAGRWTGFSALRKRRFHSHSTTIFQ